MDVTAFPAGPLTGVIHISGDPDVGPEHLRGLEVGWRFRTARKLSLDLTAFDNDYNDIITAISEEPRVELRGTVPVMLVPLLVRGALDVRARGLEVGVRWVPTEWCGLQFGSSWIHFDKRTHGDAEVVEPGQGVDGLSPARQHSVRAHFTLSPKVSLDASWEHVGRLTDRKDSAGVPGRDDVSLGIDVRLGRGKTLRVQGDRLFAGRHAEFSSASGIQLTAVRPSASVLFTWSF
jgi:iron complex outermembrane receptor protein